MAAYTDWRNAILAQIGAPIVPDNVNFLDQWNQQEGGHYNNSATYNWLNTTRGDQFPAINSHNVRAFPDFKTGVLNTAATLQQPQYQNIVALLKAGQGSQIWDKAPNELATWGTQTRPDGEAISMGANGVPVVDASMLGLSKLLGNAIAGVNSNMAGMLGQAHSQTQQAQAQQQQAFGDMQNAVNQPAPQNDPKAEFMARLMGNISQVLAPDLNGAQQAEQVIQRPIQDAQQRRAENLKLLAMKHEEAARQAEKFGDQETALKRYQQVDKYWKEFEAVSKIVDLQQRNTALTLRGSRASGVGGTSTRGANADPALVQVTGPLRDRMKSLSKAIDSGKLKGSQLMRARREYASALATNNQTLANYTPGKPLQAQPVDILDVVGSDLLQQAQKGGWSKGKLIAYIGSRPGSDQDWEHGKDGITKHDLQLWVSQNMRDGADHAQEASTPPPGVQLVSSVGAESTPDVQRLARLVVSTQQQLAEVRRKTREMGGNEALNIAPQLSAKLQKLEAKLNKAGFTIQHTIQ